ncbi:MAG: MotA/TolQ/ExbB proton channel family protein [Phycisphaerales bacterium]|nr:MAG: MotA/TolQ/ExbB proton channel family protein [Phycisphaerales bacterium]
MLFCVAIALLAGPAAAQADADTGSSGTNWFDHFVVAGGWITYVLLGISVVAIALIVEHAVTIRRATVVAPQVAKDIRELIDRREYVAAVRRSADDPSMLGYVINAGLMEAANGYGAMERAVEESIEERSSRLFRKIEFLSVIGNVSPMIGLFGTVYGMIRLFSSIREAGAIPEPGRIAGDLSIALVTTFWGLVIAIVSLSGLGWFRNRVDVLTAECALTADRLLRVFRPGGAGHGAAPRAGVADADGGGGAEPQRSPAAAGRTEST